MKNYKVKADYGDGEILGDFIGITGPNYDPIVFIVDSNGVILQDPADAVKLIEDK